jgi:hypothetical protein
VNSRHPRLFRLVWEAFLALHAVRVARTWQDAPLHPATPVVQARRLPRPVRPAAGVGGRRILIFSFTGWSTMMIWDGLLARALEQRGAVVTTFTCGGVLPLCNIHTSASQVPPMPCGRCRAYADTALGAFGFRPHHLRGLLTPEEWQQAEQAASAIPAEALISFEAEGIPLGRFASVSTRWFLLDTEIKPTPEYEQRMRQYIFLGLLCMQAIPRLLDQARPDRIVMFNGLHVPEQVLRAIASQRGIPYVCHERGYLANQIISLHNGPAPHFPFDYAWEVCRDRDLTAGEQQRLADYLNTRRYGIGQMDPLWDAVEERSDVLRSELGLHPGRPVVAAYTNVSGDTAVLDRDLGYADIRQWIDHLIEVFSARPDVDLVFRIHPAEARKPRYRPRLSFGDYIARHHPHRPPNIKVIPADSLLSSYTLLDASDLVMVYTSSMGMEAAALGKPVVVAAQVHYRGRGFTLDAGSPAELVTLAAGWDGTRASLPAWNAELARRYAYMFYFRVGVPLDRIIEEGQYGRTRLKIAGWDDLRPGADPAIDMLCDAILEGRPVLNPHEM